MRRLVRCRASLRAGLPAFPLSWPSPSLPPGVLYAPTQRSAQRAHAPPPPPAQHTCHTQPSSPHTLPYAGARPPHPQQPPAWPAQPTAQPPTAPSRPGRERGPARLPAALRLGAAGERTGPGQRLQRGREGGGAAGWSSSRACQASRRRLYASPRETGEEKQGRATATSGVARAGGGQAGSRGYALLGAGAGARQPLACRR